MALEHLRRLVERHNPQAILLGEVDVEVAQYRDYFGDNNRLNMVLNFWLNKYFTSASPARAPTR